jgi:hypothetical protein
VTEVVYVLPLLSTVLNTEINGVGVKAVVRGTAEGSLPGVLEVAPLMFGLDNLY